MKEIKLNKHFLIEIESNKFLFMPNKKEDLDHMRVIYDTNNSEKIFAIDPPDGPFIAVGAEVKGILEVQKLKVYSGKLVIFILKIH